MNATVFAVVLLAAALHAGWNALVKGGADKLMTTALVVGTAAALAMVTLPFLRAPAGASWPFIVASALVHIGYFSLVAHAYRLAEMSEAYPLMRGTAPLLVATAGAAFLGERLSAGAWCGIAMICAGILALALARSASAGKGVGIALLTAAVIATYTLIDGAGVRRSGTPAAYTLWTFLLTGAPLAAVVLRARWQSLPSYMRSNWRSGVVGGVGTVTSYGLVLWAMTTAPVAVVAALRETAILFGMAISGLILRESISSARIASACVIAGGAIVLRLV